MTVVMISGASAGVGRAVVRRFAGPGMKLGLIARDEARLEAAAQEVRAAGGDALVLPGDVADPETSERAAEQLEAAFGPIDIWINVAMVTVLAPVARTTAEEYRRVTEVTYLGTVHGTLAALKRMRPRNHGAIVQIGSALAYRSIPLQSAYCAAKAAVLGFTESLRTELLHDQSAVTVTMVQLPAVNTPQFDWARNKTGHRAQPVPPIFEPEVIADAIHHAAFHPRREYWLGFSAAKAIVADKVAPALADRYLAATGYSGQLTDAAERDRPDNLYESVPGDVGARGRFSDRASGTSPAIWASEHRDALLGLGALAATGLAAGLLARAMKGRRRG
ncbi:SDR family oxidoreductase [Pseudoroseicyclus tamaricis]|uniref:SDR family oxidoreductase n=1 Tax=Pseudoroseicyclus tamaricis TaxID=2705421 RepID=A0A6B2JQA3_9RHOB|nr:SDR family oxidoreductase [Pseudoroseicyclus tamaricis]NDV00308.1 SDR family oxidoreductase [Pseudoroseicyclus tamaricis]